MSSIKIKPFTLDLVDFLKDESNITGDEVVDIIFPRNAQELSNYFLANPNTYFYISGSRTGVVGGAVPNNVSGNKVSLISLTNFKDKSEPFTINDEAFIEVGAGLCLFELETYLKENFPSLFFPVDPTEKWASFGGMAATNASGARSFFYSSIRDWVDQLEVVLIDGTILNLKRGGDKLNNGCISLNGQVIPLPEIPKPKTKCSIGYFCKPNSDLLDLFIGAEGTLGVITKLTLKLEKKNKHVLSILQFFKDAKSALGFVKSAREQLKDCCLALEFLDKNSFNIALESQESISDQVQKANEQGLCFGVFAEFNYLDDEDIATLYEKLNLMLEPFGADIDNSICGMEDSEIDAIKRFRHAIPEGINKKIAQRKSEIPTLRKIATDMAVPDDCLELVYELYSTTLSNEKLEHYIFGHAGDNHFHVNLIPKNKSEMDRALELYEIFAHKVVEMGGAVSAEHGIGRIKKRFLLIQYPADVISDMKRIKSIFDPEFRLNLGILFD